MNALSIARRAYSAAAAPIRTPQDAEYEILARITRQIRRAAEKRSLGFAELAAALHENRKLWTVFAVDVADPENRLPRDLRARVFYLSEFTEIHTGRVLAGKAGVEPLLEINTAVLRGLRHGAE